MFLRSLFRHKDEETEEIKPGCLALTIMMLALCRTRLGVTAPVFHDPQDGFAVANLNCLAWLPVRQPDGLVLWRACRFRRQDVRSTSQAAAFVRQQPDYGVPRDA
jgi:hypothetical protein